MLVILKEHKMDYIFMVRNFWLEMSISDDILKKRYSMYFGKKQKTIDNKKEAIEYLRKIIDLLQNNIVDSIKKSNPELIIKELYKIFDECFHRYSKEKEARGQLIDLPFRNDELEESLSENANIARNIIDSVNLWIENALLFQDNLDNEYDNISFELNQELLIDMYVYGCVSRALSLISLSRKFDAQELYYGIEVQPNENTPIEILKYHPVIFFNSVLTGNQNILTEDNEFKKANDTLFAKGFHEVYGVEFILFLRMLSTFQADMLHNGMYAMTVIDKQQFIDYINQNSKELIDGAKYFDNFVLTKEKISLHLKNGEPIVWRMGVNKYRHELFPFLCLDNDRIAISYCALEQAKHLWGSLFLNGGMCYSSHTDALSVAMEKKNEELSKRLVIKIREKLNEHFMASFDEIDVRYDRIFGHKLIDYGDYDLVFYTKETNELFLIEAKFFSDSLNNSGIISDYEKLFEENGYYAHCRQRYDLVCEEPEKMRAYIGADDKIKVHFLFVSSKPLEIEFQDKDNVVTFLCLSIFDDYLNQKLLPEFGEEPVYPFQEI